MNIDQAKEEVKNAVRAYLSKDEARQYEIPVERQRPILLMGPPGIGKTAIMEQIAHDLGINLVAYTITHHTRQSAIGLPKISTRTFGGKEYSVTEYTMSEIVASVYDQIEKSGVKEGILFLDEINCVSETLAPTMLQFLQYKTFGSHKIPDGFIIVTAGNPARFNKSVRDFDIVTLDRVRQINIEEDFDAWKDYAYKASIHGAILAYLEIKKDNFYSIKTDVDGRSFVTARGWEDLSRVMKVHEKLGIAIDENLCSQYLQNTDIARDFATYYELYLRYNQV
jgi:MoxR-like ATPase